MRFAKKKVIDAQTMTGTSVITGAITDVTGMHTVSYQHVWTGTPNGTFTFEASNNYDPARPSSATWTLLTVAGITNPSGAAGDTIVTLTDLGVSHVRPKYTNASSTGVLSTWVMAKGI